MKPSSPEHRRCVGMIAMPLAAVHRLPFSTEDTGKPTLFTYSLPMKESIRRSESGKGLDTILLFDTCYLIKLLNGECDLRTELKRLSKGRPPLELAITDVVLDELREIMRSGRRGADGKALVDSRKFCDLLSCISEGLLSLERVEISERDRRIANDALRSVSDKNNQRFGDGELSIALFVKRMRDVYQCSVVSMDSDLQAAGQVMMSL